MESESEAWLQRLEELKGMLGEKDISAIVKEAKVSYDNVATNVSNQRKTAASSLSNLITEKLNQLSFNDATFRVDLIPSEPTTHGNENIQFLVSTFKGGDLQPIQKVLSGGERRLLEISRALVMKPSVLLVDEPSIGLEPKTINMVFEILEDLQKAEKKTIVLVEQNAKKGLGFADIGYVLVSGQTAIAGKGDDLLKNPDVGRLFLGG